MTTDRVPAPSTEAGRDLLDAPDVLLMQSGDEIIGLNEGELELHILAIEEQARAKGRREGIEIATRTDAREWMRAAMQLADDNASLAGLNASESPPKHEAEHEGLMRDCQQPECQAYMRAMFGVRDASESAQPPADCPDLDGCYERLVEGHRRDASESGHAPGCRMPGCEGECREASE